MKTCQYAEVHKALDEKRRASPCRECGYLGSDTAQPAAPDVAQERMAFEEWWKSFETTNGDKFLNAHDIGDIVWQARAALSRTPAPDKDAEENLARLFYDMHPHFHFYTRTGECDDIPYTFENAVGKPEYERAIDDAKAAIAALQRPTGAECPHGALPQAKCKWCEEGTTIEHHKAAPTKQQPAGML